MKKLTSFLAAAAFAFGLATLLSSTPADAAKGSCATVRCAACPDGYHLLLKWPNCCACVRN